MSRWTEHTFFLHIPRTGGTWVRQAMHELGIPFNRAWDRGTRNDVCRKHGLLHHYDRKYTDDRLIWVYVRHPVDYYSAVWRYLRKLGPVKMTKLQTEWRWHPHMYAARLYTPNYNRWVEQMLEAHAGWVSHLYDLYCGQVNIERVHWIGRTETLVDDFLHLMEQLGMRIDGDISDRVRKIGKVNASPIRSVEWRSDLREQVERSERRAIRRFYLGTNLYRRWYDYAAVAEI